MPEPQTVPVKELQTAAAKLRKCGSDATPGPWHRPLDVRNKAVVAAAKPDDEQGRYLDGRPERVGVVQLNTWSDGKHMRKRGGRDLEWIALVHPSLAEPLAAWLEASAAHAAKVSDPRNQEIISDQYALKVARVINGTNT